MQPSPLLEGSTDRVPTAPGKPGKTGPDLENLEKQGVWGQKPGKILKNPEKNFDHPEKAQEPQQKKHLEKKSSSSNRSTVRTVNFETKPSQNK